MTSANATNTATTAIRTQNGLNYKWTGTANGHTVWLYTNNPNLDCQAEPLDSPHLTGVALIDTTTHEVLNTRLVPRRQA